MMLSRTLILSLGSAALLFGSSGVQAQSGDFLAEAIARADRNDDGVVSKAEFVAYRASQFERLDRNDDGYLDRADLPRFVRDPERILARVAPFDRDGDGAVSRIEYNRGPAIAFDRADTNGDDRVTQAELAAARAAFKEEYGR